MANDIWDSTLNLLAITVIADKRVRDAELIEFCFEAQRIGLLLSPQRIVTKLYLRNWFTNNRARLEIAIARDRIGLISPYINSIEEKTVQKELLKAIFAVSICDYEINAEENEIIKAASAAWKLVSLNGSASTLQS